MAGTCIVACKVPNGLRLRAFEPQKHTENVLGGGIRDREQFFPTGEEVVIKGPKSHYGNNPHQHMIVGGYALTEGVDADFMEKWLHDHKDEDLVTKKMIFVHDKRDAVLGKAKDHAEVKSGLEPLDMSDPKNPDPRTRRGIQHPHLSRVSTFDKE